MLLTAYTNDYSLGDVCSHVNKTYALKHGYTFRSEKLAYEEMLESIHPRTHCTWYKVHMIREALRYSLENRDGFKLIVWIDADAMVINHDVTIQEVISSAIAGSNNVESANEKPRRHTPLGKVPDLVVSADMSPRSAYPLNAGVLLVKVSEWSASLWDDVWSHPSSLRYASVYFYEQSALVKCLRMRHITLTCASSSSPYSPSISTPVNDDEDSVEGLVPHVLVVPCVLLNSNRVASSRFPVMSSPPMAPASTESSASWTTNDADLVALNADGSSRAAQFIFHAVGQWNKLGVVLRVAEIYNLWNPSLLLRSPNQTAHTRDEGLDGGTMVDQSSASSEIDGVVDVFSFRLTRGKCGGIFNSSSSLTPVRPPQGLAATNQRMDRVESDL